MNERIKQLAQEADMYVDLKGTPWPKWMSAEECELAYQKFAELIVRECVSVMYNDAFERRIPPDVNRTPTTYAIAILEHFGVE